MLIFKIIRIVVTRAAKHKILEFLLTQEKYQTSKKEKKRKNGKDKTITTNIIVSNLNVSKSANIIFYFLAERL